MKAVHADVLLTSSPLLMQTGHLGTRTVQGICPTFQTKTKIQKWVGGVGEGRLFGLYCGFVYSDITGVDLAKEQFHSLSNLLAS